MSSKRRFRGGGRRFIQLYHNVKNSRAYHDLSVYGRSALVELLARYTGINNGMIGLGCREKENDPLGRKPGEYLWDEPDGYNYGTFLRDRQRET
jgi:hypothetical protein